jgi:hypothetical protein
MRTGKINRSTSDWKILIAEYESRSVSCAYFCKLHQVSKGHPLLNESNNLNYFTPKSYDI